MQRALAIATGVMAAALASGWGFAPGGLAGWDDARPAHAAAVHALVDDDTATASASIPAGFDSSRGYQPQLTGSGLLVQPGGGCSSPLGGTPWGFTPVCARHDLGYDLLRYAARTGVALGPWARRAIDDRFAADLSDRCAEVDGGLPCRFTAQLYTAAVRMNSWRQGQAAPLAEDTSRWPGALAVGAGAALLVTAVPRRRPATRAPRRAHRTGTVGGRRGDPLPARPRVFGPPAPVGVLGAGVAAAIALSIPPLLPISPTVHGVVTGILAGHGYASAVALSTAAHGLVRFRRRPAAPSGWVGPAAGASTALAAFLSMAAAGTPLDAAVLGAVAAATAAMAVLAARILRRGVSAPRPSPADRRVAPALVLALVPVLVAAMTVPPAARAPEGIALGYEGRVFLAAGRDGAARRVYVGLHDAADPAERAELAVAALDRAGAFDRAAILVVVPTGSGWVNPAAVAALEGLTGGDMATVVSQYAEQPSWLAYAAGRTEAAADSARTLVSAVRARLDEDRSPDRPVLFVYGESLGALGAQAAAGQADGVLVAGTPAARWSSTPRSATCVLHPDDPVGWFSPKLLVTRPPGWGRPWLPVVSFWHTAASLVSALDVLPGHGHRYGDELVAGWLATAAVVDVVAGRPASSTAST